MGNNPIALADPTGMFAWVPIILGILVGIDIMDTGSSLSKSDIKTISKCYLLTWGL